VQLWSTVLAADTPLLLTDGTIMLHETCGSRLFRLSPDINGSYVNGTWSQLASLPSGYSPLYYASAVLSDGRVIINGGEYNNTGSGRKAVWTNKGAIYDPTTNAWTSVSPPSAIWEIVRPSNAPPGSVTSMSVHHRSTRTPCPKLESKELFASSRAHVNHQGIAGCQRNGAHR
jgi:hypothetical protein